MASPSNHYDASYALYLLFFELVGAFLMRSRFKHLHTVACVGYGISFATLVYCGDQICIGDTLGLICLCVLHVILSQALGQALHRFMSHFIGLALFISMHTFMWASSGLL